MIRAFSCLLPLATIGRDTRGVTIVEFASALPVLVLMTFGGLEVANMAVAHMKVNQIAVSLADNASRMKQETINGAPVVREYDINEAFKAAENQGKDLKLIDNGRLMLSSLETNASGGQWIHWQRCYGKKTSYTSSYGTQGTGATGTSFAGMGPAANKVTAEKDSAIMVAEVAYDYQPLIASQLFGKLTIRKYAAMYVRDDRDLTNATDRPDGVANPVPKSTKNTC